MRNDFSIVFVDDDEQLRTATVQSLELEGLQVHTFADAPSALEMISPNFDGVIVSDIRMPRMDGLQLLAEARTVDADIPVILVTGHADVPLAIGALKDGAFDFLTKPFSPDHLIASVRKAADQRRLVLENRQLRENMLPAGDSPLIGESAVMTALRATIAQVAGADIDVLIEGETGSGKELVSVLLHSQGPRRGRPFVALNCGALPEQLAEAELFGQEIGALGPGSGARAGRIEASGGGTLFLDEIDSMPAAMQARFLRVLEEREVLRIGGERPIPVDLRVIAASKIDLSAAVADGRFREDLYYRLNVIRLRVPPLRERRDDIMPLFAMFLAEAEERVGNSTFAIDDQVRRHLADHDWPGNVRELRNYAFNAALGLASAQAPGIGPTELPLPERVQRFEAGIIRESLARHGGSVGQTLRELGIPRKTLYDKMTRLGIRPDEFRGPVRKAQ